MNSGRGSRGAEGAGVQVSISDRARQQGGQAGSGNGSDASSGQRPEPGGEQSPREPRDPEQGPRESAPEPQTAVRELRSRDQQVHQHEKAHQVVGGQYAGAPTYTYQRGPEGQLYAVGGQVSIDTSSIPDDPRATISKMRTVRSAALAPAEPSPQDIRAAQQATQELLQARAELRSERGEDAGDQTADAERSSGASEGASEDRSDTRIRLFRAVDGFTSAGADQPAEMQSGFRATA